MSKHSGYLRTGLYTHMLLFGKKTFRQVQVSVVSQWHGRGWN